jgi:hypothetical protein
MQKNKHKNKNSATRRFLILENAVFRHMKNLKYLFPDAQNLSLGDTDSSL